MTGIPHFCVGIYVGVAVCNLIQRKWGWVVFALGFAALATFLTTDPASWRL